MLALVPTVRVGVKVRVRITVKVRVRARVSWVRVRGCWLPWCRGLGSSSSLTPTPAG